MALTKLQHYPCHLTSALIHRLTQTHTHIHTTYIQFACPHMSPACEQLAFFPCTSDISALDVACSVSNDQVLCGNKGSSEPSVSVSVFLMFLEDLGP